MTTKNKKVWLAAMITTVATIIYSCEDFSEQEPIQEGLRKKTILGKKLENPYSVANMEKAYQNIISNGRIKEDIEIRTTHLYVRFLPSDYALYDMLVLDTTIHLLDRPIDVEVVEEGDYYHDPSIPESQPTWQYTAVPLGYEAPKGIQLEVLEELYLPEEDSFLQDTTVEGGRVSNRYETIIDDLVDEALRITGNLDEESVANGRTKASKWWPAGRIRLWDDALGRFMPVVGAKVHARRWFDVKEDLTDGNGNFRMSSHFRLEANYSIKWERADFDLRSGTFVQALYNGPKRKGDWNLDISSGLSGMYAIVHQAAHDYYYGNRVSLKAPPQNSFWKSTVKIAVYDNSNDEVNGSHCKDCRFLGALPRLRIFDNGGDCEQVYATTIHELAHASHWELRRNNWNDNNTQPIVKESWARGVQWAIGRLRYPGYVPPYFGELTGVVQDLVDPVDATGADRVSGYTMRQIEDVMSTTGTWEDWKNNLRNRYVNTTENGITAVFNNWN